MVKLRDARYCNLKVLLMFLVIYGHWIETGIYTSRVVSAQYKMLYLFHMPLFVFLSGLFLKSKEDCLRQIKRMLPLYILLQSAARFVGAATGLFTPWWILWYLLSFCFWAGIGWLWFRFGKERLKFICLGVAVVVGVLVCGIPWIGRTFSASRTIVFFPYFFAGLICRPDIQWQKYRIWGIVALGLALGGIWLFGKEIPVTFLYQAESFEPVQKGWRLRILCYALGGLLSFFVLTFVPMKRFPLTRAGADTLPAYLLHAPVVLFLREMNVPWVVCAVLSAILLYVIYKTVQWGSRLYGIVPCERRGRGVGISGHV